VFAVKAKPLLCGVADAQPRCRLKVLFTHKISLIHHSMPNLPRIEIEYCIGCRWLLRASWMAQELLTTFEDELGEVALLPGSGGIFEVRVANFVVWSRKEQGGFPEIKILKQLVRDQIAPDKDLGHADHN
jgi:selenoprotein W-related protein